MDFVRRKCENSSARLGFVSVQIFSHATILVMALRRAKFSRFVLRFALHVNAVERE